MHDTLTKRVAVDMDEVMADTLTRWLECYNRDFGTTITKADLHGKRLYDLVGPRGATAARAYLDRPEFFRDLPLMEGSQQIVKLLSERYEVFVTSAAMDHPNSFAAKYSWLKEHFPFIPDKRIVFCGDKSIIRADFMIDDSEQNLAAFTGKGFIFSAPHNLLNDTFPRVNTWFDIADIFELTRPERVRLQRKGSENPLGGAA
jgi:5'(3')-deoxyribonucleotidase